MTTRHASAWGVGLGMALGPLLAATPMLAAVLPHDLKIEKVLTNTQQLGELAQSPRGELWLLERTTGTIRVLVNGIAKASLTVPVTSTCDSGLLDVAFAPDYVKSGLAFIHYVDDTGVARVARIYMTESSLSFDGNIISAGVPAGGCRPGGGLDVGADGKLYVAVGDLGTAANGQDDGVLAGKVLRAELDGSVPADNDSGTLVWAKGFRNGADLQTNANGVVYVTDLGADEPANVPDEVNAVHEGHNYGWFGGTEDHPPLVTHIPTVGPQGLVMVNGTGLGDEHENTLAYACATADDIRQAVLTGPQLDELDHWTTFYDPLADADGTPDPGCPKNFNALEQGGEGSLYGANLGSNPGIWRIWHDRPGPREVSAPGSPFQLTVAKQGSQIRVAWERLGPLDAYHPPRTDGGQDESEYRIWEGTLPIGGTYDHEVIEWVADNPLALGRLNRTFAPGAGDRYYLVSAQGDNLEGPMGAASDGTPRPGSEDHCDTIGEGLYFQCPRTWTSPVDGTPIKLTDYNPASPTYLQQVSPDDFRGNVIHIDISSNNCTHCRIQAPWLANVEEMYEGRDYVSITVFTLNYVGVTPIPPASCGLYIEAWADLYGIDGPIVCDIDLNGDNHGDVSWQLDWAQCGGTPRNFFYDQSFILYNRMCGRPANQQGFENTLVNEINPESCE